MDDVRRAVNIVVEKLDAAGIAVNKDPDIVVQNMVAVYDLHSKINLNVVAISLSLDQVEYEPEQFPGLGYRLTNPKVVALLFGSGKVVLTGAKKIEDVNLAAERIREDLSAAGLLH